MVEMSKLTKDNYTYDEFITMVKANPDLAAVRVHKRRFGYMVNDTICEFGEVLTGYQARHRDVRQTACKRINDYGTGN